MLEVTKKCFVYYNLMLVYDLEITTSYWSAISILHTLANFKGGGGVGGSSAQNELDADSIGLCISSEVANFRQSRFTLFC